MQDIHPFHFMLGRSPSFNAKLLFDAFTKPSSGYQILLRSHFLQPR